MKNTKSKLIICGGVLLSILIFLIVFGVRVIDPSYVDWRFLEADTMHDYIGWCGYRNSEWTFPLGLFSTLSYPDYTSIIFSDSIPLFAVFFKAISPVLPETFQYFGLFALICYMLQGYFSIRIISKYTNNVILMYLFVVFICLFPVMVFKFFTNTALGAHWLILFSIYILLNVKDFTFKKTLICIALLALFSAGIHIYFILLSGIMLLGIVLYYYLSHRIRKRQALINSLILILLFLLVGVVTVFLLGGFSVEMDTVLYPDYKDMQCLNLNSFINSFLVPTVFGKALPATNVFQNDGMAYLGIGAIIITGVALVLVISKIIKKEINAKLFVSLVFVFFISLIFAISPVITLNDSVIYVIPIPSFINKIWLIFRYSSRAVWNCLYIICVLSFCVIAKELNVKIAASIMILALVLNIFDFSNFYIEKREYYANKHSFDSHYDEIYILNSIKNDRKHVVLCDKYEDPVDSGWIWNWIVQNNYTCNAFYFAREDLERYKLRTEKSLENISDDTIYVFNKSKESYKRYEDTLNLYKTNQYVIGTSR